MAKDTTHGTILVGEENGTLSEVTIPNMCTVVELDVTVTPMVDKFNGMSMDSCFIRILEAWVLKTGGRELKPQKLHISQSDFSSSILSYVNL